jgi:hypothetical protein
MWQTLRLPLEAWGANSLTSTSTPSRTSTAFTAMARQRVAALVVSATAYLNTRRDQIIKLVAHHAIREQPGGFGRSDKISMHRNEAVGFGRMARSGVREGVSIDEMAD